jgi:hypothetical protein
MNKRRAGARGRLRDLLGAGSGVILVLFLAVAGRAAPSETNLSDRTAADLADAMDRSLRLRSQAFAELPRQRTWGSTRIEQIVSAGPTDDYDRRVYIRALEKNRDHLIPAYRSGDAHRMRDAMRSFTVAELAALDDLILSNTRCQGPIDGEDFSYAEVLSRCWQAVRNGSPADYRPVFLQKSMRSLVLNLPGGKTFTTEKFFPREGVREIFDDCQSRKDDYSILMPERQDGTPFAVIHQQGGKLHGFSCAEFQDGGLMMYGGFTKNERDVQLLVLSEDRSIRFAGEYDKGDREGMTCLFHHGRPVLAQVCKNDGVSESHLFDADGRVIASASGDADGNPAFKEALALAKKVEDELREGEKKVKVYVEKVEHAVRTWRAAQNGAVSRARFGQLQSLREVQGLQLIGGLRELSGR